MKTLTAADLAQAQAGSYYTIRGAGGDIGVFINQVTDFMETEGVGTPQEFFTTKGYEVNDYARQVKRGEIVANDKFQPELTFLMFPLDGLNIGRLAILRLQMEDVWFDDMIENMRLER